MFNDKSILVTGGTGSFGKKFIQTVLDKYEPNRLIVFSRDELKQFEMQQKFPDNDSTPIRYFIGDIRDYSRLKMAMKNVDIVVHAAALKQVPAAEYNPFEAVKTNIIGSQNVIDACLSQNVEKTIALSTDKAAAPSNLYGATKLTSDKLFIAANNYSGDTNCKFSVVRYGNVMGSRGSVIPYFYSLRNSGKMPITDPKMTRFMITLDQGIDLVFDAFADMLGGEIYIKKIPSMNIIDIAKAIDPNAKHEVIGIRPGEKLHEQMIGEDDAAYTYEYDDYYKILPAINDWHLDKQRINGGRKVNEGFSYSSENNEDWMNIDSLAEWVRENYSE